MTSELSLLASAFADLRWAQGPGGNVSVKAEGSLFVKASGTRLSDVATGAGHVAVPLADAEAALEGDTAADARVFGRAPRPSLETYFHALPGPVVAHTHVVSAILVACADRDVGVRFDARVPYQRPGRDLALAIRASTPAKTVLLESHGLLVFAASATEAIEISRSINAQCLAALSVDASRFDAMIDEYRKHPVVAVDGGFTRRLPPRGHGDRYLFPDAVVFASVYRMPRADEDAAARGLTEHGRALVVVDDAQNRIAVAKTESALDSCIEVLAAHDWVEDELLARNAARYLDRDEPRKILGLPSEQYRIAGA